MSAETPTGIPIIDCATCGRRHPETRRHCEICGAASLFSHETHARKEGNHHDETDRRRGR